MNQLVLKCQEFLKTFQHPYAFCGGYALELFAGLRYRTHSDVDITLFQEDRENIVSYILDNGWNVYEHLHVDQCLRSITDPKDNRIHDQLYLWAIKPDCSFIWLKPKPGETAVFQYDIIDPVQHSFDFIDIIFNPRIDDSFVCDTRHRITRSLHKAILYRDTIPYLAPEVILFFISNPAYLASDYHREKNQMDWNTIPPLLPRESRDWLTNAISTAYPEGNKRLDELLG